MRHKGYKVLDILRNKLSVEEVSENEISSYYLASEKENIVNSYKNDELGLSKNKLKVVIVKIIKNEASSKYFLNENGFSDCENGMLYVLLELQTGYFISNSNRLFAELVYEVGISKEDRDNNTIAYQEYLSKKNFLDKGYS